MSDRVPPHHPHAESAVVGACLLSAGPLRAVRALGLRPEHFYAPRWGRVWAAMCRLDDAGAAVDAVTAGGELPDDSDAMLQAMMDTPGSHRAADYARMVMSGGRHRQVIAAAAAALAAAWNAPDGDSAHAAAAAEMDALRQAPRPAMVHISEPLDMVLAGWDEVDAGAAAGGLPCGIGALDAVTGGMRPGEVTVVGGRTGSGKTAFGLAAAMHAAAAAAGPVWIFNLEMTNPEVARRALVAAARAQDPTLLPAGSRPDAWRRIRDALPALAAADLWVCDEPAVTVPMIRSMVAGGDPRPALVVVDYLQLVSAGPADSRVLQVAEITRGLKLCARESQVPVLALSQLRRADNPRDYPRLDHLRESGAIEQDADVVILLHRPPGRGRGGGDPDLTEPQDLRLMVAKNRHGPQADVDVKWYPAWALVAAAEPRSLPTRRERLPYRD